MASMDIGIALTPTADCWKVVQRAEELGFSHAWFYDTQLLCTDILVAMTAAAMSTKKIKLGAGVLVPSNRNVAVAANAMASLNALAPGRIIAGLGTGYTARRTMGLGAHKLREVHDYAETMRALWRGEIVSDSVENKHHKFTFMHPDDRFVNTTDDIPVHISAFGPKARKLAAEHADGFINAWMSPNALEEIKEVKDQRRKLDNHTPLYSTCLNLGCILQDGEAYDSPRARAQAGPWPAIAWHWFVEDGDKAQIPPALQPLIEQYREVYLSYEPEDARYITLHSGHLMYLRPEEEQFVTGEMLKALTLTGRPNEIIERRDALQAAGYDQTTIQIVPGHESELEQWAKVLIRR